MDVAHEEGMAYFGQRAKKILGELAVVAHNPRATKYRYSCHAGCQEWNEVFRGRTISEALEEAEKGVKSLRVIGRG